MQVTRYSAADAQAWDALVDEAASPTFLFRRAYMDYHAERFEDCSLMFRSERGALLAVLPANRMGDDVQSHGGLTYGGLIHAATMHATDVLASIRAAAHYFSHALHAKRWLYKPMPTIYARYPNQGELYALFRCGAQLVARGLSSAIDLSTPLQLSELRQRCIVKAEREHISVQTMLAAAAYKDFWYLLRDVLMTRHQKLPVHSLDELWLLHQRFPREIQLLTAQRDGQMLAGTILYHTPRVTHAQYIASSEAGRTCGALDIVLHEAIRQAECAGKAYFDFGISTEQGGQYLNEGLLRQKEGFGARGICYDHYLINLDQLEA